MSKNKYCTKCGQKLSEEERFCSGCGNSTTGDEGTVSSESLIGIIPGIHRKKGIFKSETFSLLVTDKRLVFITVTKEIMKEQAAQLQGTGFLSRMQNATSGEYITRRYLDMTPEQALSETQGNFALDISEIKKVKIKASTTRYDSDSSYESDGALKIRTSKEKLSFVLPASSEDTAKTIFKRSGLI